MCHLAVAVADGADRLSDLAVLRDQQELFGLAASHATAWRAIEAVAAPELRGIARAAAVARQQVWTAAGGPETVTWPDVIGGRSADREGGPGPSAGKG